jgi:surface polysaccharide O-acyltransferase-like enzyme
LSSAAPDRRVQYLDVLRVFSMLSVVFLHSISRSVAVNLGSNVWHLANVTTAIASTAVPLFFMISGALLLDSRYTLSMDYTLKRRLPRVLLPFIAWSLIAVVYLALFTDSGGGSRLATAVTTTINLPGRQALVHLWFMYALIPLYLLSPLIKTFVDSVGPKLMAYTLGLWLVFASLLPMIATFLPERYRPLAHWGGAIPVNSFVGFAGYFLAGYWLMKAEWRVPARWLMAIAVADVMAMVVATWAVTRSTGYYTVYFKTYTSTTMVILSVAVFLLAKGFMETRRLGRVGNGFIGFLVPISFGVYLCHLFVRDIVGRAFDWSLSRSIPGVIAFYLMVAAGSILAVFLFTRIKGVSYVLAGQKYRGLGRSRASSDAGAVTCPEPMTGSPEGV